MKKYLIVIFLSSLCSSLSQANTTENLKLMVRQKVRILEEKASAAGGNTLPGRHNMMTVTEAQSIDPHGLAPLDNAMTCLARALYWEAKGEGKTGMQAVANVIMNRLGKKSFPNTLCGVVKQGAKGRCQFSWWCDGRSDGVENIKAYKLAKEIARQALNQQLIDKTKGALYFHNHTVKPRWSRLFKATAIVGRHIFYKPKPALY